MASSTKTIALAQDLADKIEDAVEPALQEQVVKFIETVLVYKFPQLSRQEIEAMFNYSDLKKTRVYQEAKEEGEQIGLQVGMQIGLQKVLQGQVSMLKRMLTRKFGQLSPRTSSKISKLSAIQLENLADVIFDLQTTAELNAWLRKNS